MKTLTSTTPRKPSRVELLENECRALRSAIFRTAHLSEFRPLAWTGGESPRKPSARSLPEIAYARALFRQQVNTWRNYWKDSPDRDTLRTFYRRAVADSFATFRGALNG
jgi:hypothetical protein